ncbi:hypothetical protein [Hydrogenophaga sp.]|uniref:hypothetical protein n=1 Tax=Hydrogenophaga sp. TaxID=1904254 RepID=UPI003F6BF9C0
MSTAIQTLSDDAAAVARSLANSTERAAHQGMGRMADSLEDARWHTSAALKRARAVALAPTEMALARDKLARANASMVAAKYERALTLTLTLAEAASWHTPRWLKDFP